jgi:hypothetical protein
MSTAGIMNPGFFVSKSELIKWVNGNFKFDYVKVEQSCTGALHCQILDCVFPGKVPLHKVNFHATQVHNVMPCVCVYVCVCVCVYHGLK